MAGDNNFQSALQNMQVDNQQSPEQQKKEMEVLRLQYENNDTEFARIVDIFFEIKDAREDVEDDMKVLFDKAVSVCHRLIDTFDDFSFGNDIFSGQKVIKKQERHIKEIEKEIQEMAQLADVKVVYDKVDDKKVIDGKQKTEVQQGVVDEQVVDKSIENRKKESNEQISKEVLKKYNALKVRIEEDYSENEEVQKFVVKRYEFIKNSKNELDIVATISQIEEKLQNIDTKDNLAVLRKSNFQYRKFITGIRETYKENTKILEFVGARDSFIYREKKAIDEMEDTQQKNEAVEKLLVNIVDATKAINIKIAGDELKSLKIDDSAYQQLKAHIKKEYEKNQVMQEFIERKSNEIRDGKNQLRKITDIKEKEKAVQKLQVNIDSIVELMKEKDEKIKQEKQNKKKKEKKKGTQKDVVVTKKTADVQAVDEDDFKKEKKEFDEDEIAATNKTNARKDIQTLDDGEELLFDDDELFDLEDNIENVTEVKTDLANDVIIDEKNIAHKSDDEEVDTVIIEGIESLEESDSSVIQEIFKELKADFEDIDKKDEKVVNNFWNNDVPNRIKEEDQLEDHSKSVKNIVAVLKVNFGYVDNDSEGVKTTEENVDSVDQKNSEKNKLKKIEEQLGSMYMDVLVKQTQLFYEQLEAQGVWDDYDNEKKESEIKIQTMECIEDIVGAFDATYEMTSDDVLTVFKRAIT